MRSINEYIAKRRKIVIEAMPFMEKYYKQKDLKQRRSKLKRRIKSKKARKKWYKDNWD